MTTKRKILAAGLIFSGLVAAFFLFLSSRKKAPAFDGDLQPVRANIAEQNNAFYFLTNAAAAIYWPEDKSRELQNLSSGKDWDAAFAAEVLAKNAEALALFERALACTELQVPVPKEFTDKSPSDEYPYLGQMRTLATLATIQANQLVRDGKEQEALAMAMRIVQYGHRAENSGGVLMHYLVGSAIKQIGLRQVRRIAWETTLPPEQLTSCIAKLEAFKANAPGLTNTLKSEYYYTAQLYDRFKSGQFSGTNSPLEQMFESAGSKLTFNLEQTKNLLAQNIRVLLKNIPRHLSEMQLSEISTGPTKSSMLKMFLRGNASGEILVGMTSPAWINVLTAKCRENSIVSATQLSLALKCHQIEHGRLPESLSELVPKYLLAIPLDDFDGKPLRYSKERQLIWSVGKDLIDSGGKNSKEDGGPDDILFEIGIKIGP